VEAVKRIQEIYRVRKGYKRFRTEFWVKRDWAVITVQKFMRGYLVNRALNLREMMYDRVYKVLDHPLFKKPKEPTPPQSILDDSGLAVDYDSQESNHMLNTSNKSELKKVWVGIILD
jgi:hypothetical protein